MQHDIGSVMLPVRYDTNWQYHVSHVLFSAYYSVKRAMSTEYTARTVGSPHMLNGNHMLYRYMLISNILDGQYDTAPYCIILHVVLSEV